MKNILNKIYIHPIFLLNIFIFISIGYFRFLIFFMMLIIIHELGHIVISLLFKWNIDKIIILPFGGLTKYNEIINRPLIEEFLIAIAGILFQLIFYILIKNNIDYKYFDVINYFIIVFNLLPIYPLDGGKLLNMILSLKFSFKSSYKISILISYLVACLFLIMFISNISINVVVIFLFLIYKITFEYRRINYFYEKFLLERYLNKYNFNSSMIIDNVNKFYRNKRHLVKKGDIYYTEKEILEKKYKSY